MLYTLQIFIWHDVHWIFDYLIFFAGHILKLPLYLLELVLGLLTSSLLVFLYNHFMCPQYYHGIYSSNIQKTKEDCQRHLLFFLDVKYIFTLLFVIVKFLPFLNLVTRPKTFATFWKRQMISQESVLHDSSAN